jgi:hypothetical protein
MGTFLFGTSYMTDVYRAFWGKQNIWWTHQSMRLSVDETRKNFELYIGEKSLQEHLSGGTLFAADKNGGRHPIVSEDISVRLNNWDKVQASILTYTTVSGIFLGISIALLVIGLIRVFSPKR